MMDPYALRTQTETGVEQENHVSTESLFLYVNQFKAQGARFITITARDMGDGFQVIYHFELDNQVTNLYMTVDKEKAVPSITGLYGVAFIAENEVQDLFGLRFSDLNIDLGGRMLKVAPDVGTCMLKTVDGPRPTIARKLSKCSEECPAMVDIPRYVRQV